MFDIDLSKYRIIDLSYEVVPPGTDDRPFIIRKGLLDDDAFKHDIITHSHVGTHVEAPSHFFHHWDHPKTITDLPLSAYMGRGILLSVRLPKENLSITEEYLDDHIGDIIRPDDIVVCRDDCQITGEEIDPQAPVWQGRPLPYFELDTAYWLRDRGVKMLVLDELGFGRDNSEARKFHEIIQGEDVTLVEFVDNLDQLQRREFYVMALPFKARGLDSMWARVIAIEEI